MKFIKHLFCAFFLIPLLNAMAMSPTYNPFNISPNLLPSVKNICEKVFNSNYELGILATSTVYREEFIIYKLSIITDIYNILACNAFTKGDPFNNDKLELIFRDNKKFLLESSNYKDLCARIMTMLRANNYTMSHLFIASNPPNNNNNNLAPAPPPVLIHEFSIDNSSVIMIKFDSFSWDTYSQVESLIKQAINDNKNILFDVRNNCGGLVSVMKKLLGLLLEPNTVVALLAQKSLVQRYSVNSLYDSTSLVEHAINSPFCDDYLLQTSPGGEWAQNYQAKLAVLVGPGSRSAAENFAYALNVIENATIIGTPTLGRALLSLERSADNGVVTFPVGELLHCDGTSIEGVGLTPNLNTDELGLDECIRRWLSGPAG